MTTTGGSGTQSSIKEAIASFSMLTLCTDDLKGVKKFFVKGLGFKMSDHVLMDETYHAKQADLWGIAPSEQFELYYLYVKDSKKPLIRIVFFKEPVGSIRDSMNYEEIGISGINWNGLKRIKKKHLANISDEQFSGIYKGPGNIQYVLSESKSGTEQATNFNLLITLEHLSDEVRFYSRVFGLKKSISNNNGAVVDSFANLNKTNLEAAEIMQIQQEDEVYATLIKYPSDRVVESENPSRFPAVGWVMMSYQCTDLGEVLARAHASGITVGSTPRKIVDPFLGDLIAMTLISPNGLLYEVFTKV